MNAWQIEEMIATDAAAAWERLNAPDPCEKQLKSAAVSLKEAAEFLNVCTDRLVDAGCELDETPMRAKVDSLCETLEDFRCEIQELARLYGKGVRE